MMFLSPPVKCSVNAVPIWFPFTIKLLLGPGKVNNYFCGKYHLSPKIYSPLSNFLIILFKLEEQVLLEAYRGVTG